MHITHAYKVAVQNYSRKKEMKKENWILLELLDWLLALLSCPHVVPYGRTFLNVKKASTQIKEVLHFAWLRRLSAGLVCRERKDDSLCPSFSFFFLISIAPILLEIDKDVEIACLLPGASYVRSLKFLKHYPSVRLARIGCLIPLSLRCSSLLFY